jgi:quercetin dioxygenase-like cupin family protein
MPYINKPIVLASGDSIELLETSAMSSGERVRTRIVFAAGGIRVPPHVHPLQDETLEVLSGELTYVLADEKHVVNAGSSVRLPRGIGHQHYSEGPAGAVTIQTMTPGLDFDYLLENLFGFGAEGRLKGILYPMQLLVFLGKMKSAFAHAHIPLWFQKGVATFVTPIAYLFGYRAVYRRFSGEEW